MRAPDLRRTWLFGPGADSVAHTAMQASGADALIADFEDGTPQQLRDKAREGIGEVIAHWNAAGCIATVRINALDTDGPLDLEAAMRAKVDVIVYPMAASAQQMFALDSAMSYWERMLDLPLGSTEIVPVCETARGVVNVREISAASKRIRAAILGTEDLANDLCAERSAEGLELDYARRRFVLECRAAGIEPIDAPYTFRDAQGAVREAQYARRLGYRCKSLVLPEHAKPINEALTPSDMEITRAKELTDAFDAARARGQDRALVGELWVEVPTYRNAKRLVDRDERLSSH